MRTPYKIQRGIPPNNLPINTFREDAYTHVQKQNRNTKLDNNDEIGLYSGSSNGHYGKQSFRRMLVVETKHVSFQKGCLPFRKKREVYIDLSTDVSTSNGSANDAHKLETTSVESRASGSRYMPNNQNIKVIDDRTQSGHMY